MESMHYIGLDIHKRIIAFCIKTFNGKIVNQGKITAARKALNGWPLCSRLKYLERNLSLWKYKWPLRRPLKALSHSDLSVAPCNLGAE